MRVLLSLTWVHGRQEVMNQQSSSPEVHPERRNTEEVPLGSFLLVC